MKFLFLTEELEVPFKEETLSISFGGENSCNFFPLNIQLSQGGPIYHETKETSGCSKRDIFLGECLDCEIGHNYDPVQRNCSASKVFDYCYSEVCLNSFQGPTLSHCEQQLEWKCIQCEEGMHPFGDDALQICIQDCPPNMYSVLLDNGEFRCENCSIPLCNVCLNSTVCDLCEPGFLWDGMSCVKDCQEQYYYNNECVPNCPESTYPDSNKICLPCSKNCGNCTAPDSCLLCQNSATLVNNHCYILACDGNRESDCDCPRTCSRCKIETPVLEKSSVAIRCTLCNIGFVLYEGECLMQCPPGTSSSGGICEKCTHFFHYPNGTEGCTIGQCPPGYYSPNSDGFCTECTPSCFSCFTHDLISSLGCFTCELTHVISYLECRETCPQHHYSSSGRCYTGERRCKNWGTEPCANCLSNDVYYEVISQDKSCHICKTHPPFELRMQIMFQYTKQAPYLKTRDISPFILVKDDTCDPCNTNCISCTLEHKCEKCVDGYYLTLNGRCSTRCPSGSFATSLMTCEKCPEGCEICISSNKCIVCSGNLVLNDAICESYLPRSITRYYKINLERNSLLRSKSGFDYSTEVVELGMSVLTVLENIKCPKISFNVDQYIMISMTSKITTDLSLFCQLGVNVEPFEHCQSSCLFCIYDQESLAQKCLQCLPILQDGAIQGDKCRCPDDRPFYDHNTTRCVASCPEGSLLITETSECVITCLTLSLFSDDLFFYQLENTCNKGCPEGYNAIFNFDSYDVVRCVPQGTLDLYQKLMVKLEQINPIPRNCAWQDPIKSCKLNKLASSLDVEGMQMAKEYLDLLLIQANIRDIAFQNRSYEIISSYILNSHVSTFSTVKSFLQVLTYLGYGCNSNFHPYYILVALDSILSQLSDLLDHFSFLTQIFDSLVQCFENLDQRGFNDFPSLYIGSKLTCEVFSPHQIQRVQQYLIDQQHSFIQVQVTSIFKRPLSLLTCNFTINGLQQEQYSFYQVGVFSQERLNKWWELEIHITSNPPSSKDTFYLWNTSALSWSAPSSIQARFSPISYSKALVYAISLSGGKPLVGLKSSKGKNSSFLVYLTLGVFLLTFILLIYFMYKRLAQAVNHTRVKRKEESEEAETVMELQKMEETIEME